MGRTRPDATVHYPCPELSLVEDSPTSLRTAAQVMMLVHSCQSTKPKGCLARGSGLCVLLLNGEGRNGDENGKY